MKIARVSLAQGPRYAVLDEERGQYVLLADDPMFGSIEPTGQTHTVEEAHLVAPMLPRSKVIGFDGTYDGLPLDQLTVTIKPNTSVGGPDDPVTIPEWTEGLEYRAELAVVISRVAKEVPVARAHEVIFGYTLADNITATGVGSARAQLFDGSLPLGPVIVTDLDAATCDISLALDGKEVGRRSTADLTYSAAELVAYASTICTLLPGDIILTGTAVKVSGGRPGELVQISAGGIGSMAHRALAA